MHFSSDIHQYLTWVFVSFSVFFFSLSVSDNRTAEAGLFCGTNKLPTSEFIPNFVQVMEHVSAQISLQHWGSFSVTSYPPIYAFAQCHEDLSTSDCQLCFARGRTMLPRCLPYTSARIYLDGCYLRYDNYSFFTQAQDPENDVVHCEETSNILADRTTRDAFVLSVDKVLGNVTEKAVANAGFAVAEFLNIAPAYALAQCWSTINSTACGECLRNASAVLRNCVPRVGGRAMYAGCYLRYSANKFFDLYSAQGDNARKPEQVNFAAIVVVVVVVLMLIAITAYMIHKKVSKTKQERNNIGRISSTVAKSNLNFKYEILEKATDFFDASRKLGQGGAGSVYKGTLPDGRIVAVKRLCFNTRQWVDDFFNEVNLISGIKHKNLVSLLGCSIEGPESLLVYEYVPNKSLDQFLFDKNKTQMLSWQQRFHIIFGTAEGLAYLHGGSEAKIIHRDIKSSNVLLDENLNPKIADFGLARCVAPDKSHITTGIAGTLGYMAPEYLVRGQLTEKADVYAFGVLVLEIVTGRKNSIYVRGAGSILQTVWKNYKLSSIAQAVDPCLEGDFPVQQASNVLQVGLLCTQASVALRPSMSEVVQMIANEESQIPPPQQPPFLNASVLSPDDGTKSSFMMTSPLSGNMNTEFQLPHTRSPPVGTSGSNGPSTVTMSESR